MRNQLRVDNLERIDRGDFEFAVQTTPQDHAKNVPANFLTNPNGTRAWIVDGFKADNPASAQLRVQRGIAMLAFRNAATIDYGAVATQGDAQKILDLSGYSDGTYSVFIRFEYVDGDFQNRVFWNPTADSEFTQNIPSRRIANWGMQVVLASPGAEWLEVATVTIVSSAITLIIDTRPLYFEGNVGGAYSRSWGGGNDRNVNRQQYGLKDLRTTLDALLKKVEEIQTGTNPSITTDRWWSTPATGSLDNMIPLSGSAGASTRVYGNIEPDGNTRELGADTRHWNGWFDRLTFNDVSGGLKANITGINIGEVANRFNDVYIEDLNWAGALVPNTGATIAGDMVPVLGNFYDLGEAFPAGDGWANGYFETAVYSMRYRQEVAGGTSVDNLWEFTSGGAGAIDLHFKTSALSDEWMKLGINNGDAIGYIDVGLNSGFQLKHNGTAYMTYLSSGLAGDDRITFDETYNVGKLVDYSGATNPARAAGVSNEMNKKSPVKAWGYVVTDGAAGITTQEGMNFTATISGSIVRITFGTGMVNANYCVVVTNMSTGSAPYEQSNVPSSTKTTALFDIHSHLESGGTEAARSASTNVVAVSFVVYGEQ